MAETAELLLARAAGALRMPPVEEWETFPVEGELRPRELLPPLAAGKPRDGENGVDRRRCAAHREDVWRENLAAVADALSTETG